MGKGNRTRQQKAANVLASGTGNKNKAGQKREMPTWVGTLIVVAVLAVIVLFSVFCILNSRGVFVRNKVIAKTEHFEVTVPMMSYMVYTEYQNWVNQYESTGYMQYIKGEGGQGLSTSTPLREQLYSSKDGVEVTWFDKFADSAATSVEQILVLCEQAHRYGITLNEEEIANVDNAMMMLQLYAAYSGYTTSGYISAMYGRGVSQKDVRAMMELSELATKMTNIKTEEFENGATDVRVENYYNEHKDDFDVYVSYISYTFETKFDAVDSKEENAATKNAEAAEKYVAEQNKYKERVAALAACTTSKDFCDLLIKYLQEDGMTNAEAVKKQSDAHHIEYEKSEDEDKLEAWLFDTKNPIKANDTHVIESEGDTPVEQGGEDEEPTYRDSTSTYTVCFVLEPVHKDDAPVQNVGHILFKTETFKDLKDTSQLTGKTKELAQSLLDKGETISAEAMAKALIEKMIADGKMVSKTDADGNSYYTISKADFEAYGKDYTEDSNVFYEEVKRGDMVTEFDAWIYDESRIDGEIGAAAVKTTYGYHIMYYVDAGEEANWVVIVKNELSAADYEAWYKAVSDKAACPIEVIEKHWKKIK